jgi:DNA-binding NtrC family response regulator
LDERKDDIPLLINYFVRQICQEQGWKTKTFSSEAMVALQQRTWPGNIRELRNVVERLIILSGDVITEQDVQIFGM